MFALRRAVGMLGMASLLMVPALAGLEPRDIFATTGQMEFSSIPPLPDGWRLLEQSSNLDCRASLDTTTASQGRSSLKVYCPIAPQYTTWAIRNLILVGQNGLKVGDHLQLSADVKTGEMQNATVLLQIRCADAQGNTLSSAETAITASNSSWQTYRLQIDVPEGSAWVSVGIRVRFGKGGGWCTFWVDNMLLNNGEQVERPVSARRVIRTFTYFRMHPDIYETARRFDIVTLHPVNWLAVRALRYYNPNIEVYAYFNGPATSSTLDGQWDALDYAFVNANHPEWFLTDSTGKRLTEKDYPQNYLVDIGNVELQRRWASRAIAIAKRFGFTGVYIDNMVRNYLSLQAVSPIQYPSEAAYQTAMGMFLQAVSAQIKQAGLKVLANFGYVWADDDPPYNEWMHYVDGALAENWVRSYWGGSYRFYSSFDKYLRAVDVLTKHGNVAYLAQGRAVEAETLTQRFLLASALLNADAHTYFHTANAGYTENAHYLPDYELSLGTPIETYTLIAGDTASGGVLRRRWSQGLVLVNAHMTRSFTVPLDSQYIDANGTLYPAGVVELPPLSALILAKAGDKMQITVSMTPSTAKPGDTVSVEVTAKNLSAETLQQVTLRLPIPKSLSYVAGSATQGGAFDAVSGTMTWTIPSLAPGALVTLSFRAVVR